MSIREEQCRKVCRILDDVLANRPTERDALCVAVDKAFDALSQSECEKDEWIEAWVSGFPAIHHRRCNTYIYAPNGKKGYNYCPRCGWAMKGASDADEKI